MRHWLISMMAGMGIALFAGVVFGGPSLNGFDLSKHSVPTDQILSGGPGKDGIPALLKPLFVSASDATFLNDQDRVLGLHRGQESKAYPIKILNWHEIVNDKIGGKPVVVTYCPLCGTGIGFDSLAGGRTLTFGVSGLLYQSDLVMYDHETESLWSQISMDAIAGPLTGTKLTHLFLAHTTWGEWRAEHPTTLVLSTKTGHSRNYERDPYLGYAESPELMFTPNRRDPSYHTKEWVLGLEVKGAFKAYPFAELKKRTGPLTDQVNGEKVRILYNPATQNAVATDLDGKPIPSVMAFWFAWYAFHPDTQIFKVGA